MSRVVGVVVLAMALAFSGQEARASTLPTCVVLIRQAEHISEMAFYPGLGWTHPGNANGWPLSMPYRTVSGVGTYAVPTSGTSVQLEHGEIVKSLPYVDYGCGHMLGYRTLVPLGQH